MAGKHYSRDELHMIATMRDRGFSIPAVAKQLGRTPAGIQCALRARHSIDTTRSRVMSSVHIFSSPEQRAFREFVRSRAAGHTPSDIREEWNRDAAPKGWPTVNNERVTYYLREIGLQKTRREYMQLESYRRKQSIAQTRRRAKERQARLRAMKARRAEVHVHVSDLPRRKCRFCLETWPLTEEFFRHAASGAKYFLNTCRMCSHHLTGTATERRKQQMHMYDCNVVIKQISAAKAERDAFLHQHRKFPTRGCSRCQEIWELLPKRFPTYKRAAGGELYRRTCRFCLRTSERLKERAKKDAVWPTVSCSRGTVERIIRVAATAG
jgi:hypothetical protein